MAQLKRLHVVRPNAMIRSLIVFLIAITPLTNVMDILSLFNKGGGSVMGVKVAKDALCLVLMGLGTMAVAVRRRCYVGAAYLLLMGTAVISLVATLQQEMDPYLLAAGMRWLIPLALFPFVYGAADLSLQKRVARVMVALFFLALALQVLQLFFSSGLYGLSVSGLSLRNPGFYLIPSSMAMFTMLTLFYAQHFLEGRRLKRAVIYLLGPVSILLTASGTGVLALLVFYFVTWYCTTRHKSVVILLFLFLAAAVLVVLPVLAQRSDVYSSIMTRGEIFADIFRTERLLFSDGFGTATNTAVSLVSYLGTSDAAAFIADSTLTSLVGNTGALSMVLFLLFFLRPARRTLCSLHFLAIYVMFMITVIVFELAPANILLVVNLAFFYKARKGAALAPSPAAVPDAASPACPAAF